MPFLWDTIEKDRPFNVRWRPAKAPHESFELGIPEEFRAMFIEEMVAAEVHTFDLLDEIEDLQDELFDMEVLADRQWAILRKIRPTEWICKDCNKVFSLEKLDCLKCPSCGNISISPK